jgi:hypothetical protein
MRRLDEIKQVLESISPLIAGNGSSSFLTLAPLRRLMRKPIKASLRRIDGRPIGEYCASKARSDIAERVVMPTQTHPPAKATHWTATMQFSSNVSGAGMFCRRIGSSFTGPQTPTRSSLLSDEGTKC